MGNWFSKILSNNNDRGVTRIDGSIEEGISDFIAFLREQVKDKNRALLVLDSSKVYLKLKPAQRIKQLPFIYLTFEQYITDVESEHTITKVRFRRRVREQFQFLLEIPEFTLIFESKTQQQILLCREFIKKMLQNAIENVGDAQEGFFKKLESWVNVIPNIEGIDSSFLGIEVSDIPSIDWIELLEKTTGLVFSKLENQFGLGWTKLIFEKAYNSTAKSYSLLDTFPIVISLIPDKFLDAEKIGRLNKHQLTNVLIDKAAYLEKLNASLKEKNLALEEAQQAILDGKMEVEKTLSRFSSVLKTVNEGIIHINTQSVIIFVNPAVQYIFGYSETELIGKKITILMPSRYVEGHNIGMKRYITSNEATVLNQTVQLEGRRKDGSIFPLEINIAESKIDNHVYFTAAVKDITERVRMEQELIQSRDKLEIRVQERTKDLQNAQQELSDTIKELKRSNSELEQFAYVVSHDLQEPLRVIGGYSQLLQKKLGNTLPKDAQVFLAFINEGVSRMSQLIKDLLSYSKVGKANANFKLTNLNHLILLAKNSLKTQIDTNQVQIINDELPILKVDKTLMTQLFQNLLGNAIKYRSERRPLIKISVNEQEDFWQFSIQDNGLGIKAEYLDKIFIVFQRATEENIEGSGIGLAVCQKIVELHKGKIWVESIFGKGSTFYFTLPKE